MEGVACINIDHTLQNEQRAYIRHLSTKNKTDFEKALKLVLEFIWAYLNADQTRLDLYHFKEEGSDEGSQVKADAELKKIVAMNRLGFKWKTLINDSGLRF